MCIRDRRIGAQLDALLLGKLYARHCLKGHHICLLYTSIQGADHFLCQKGVFRGDIHGRKPQQALIKVTDLLDVYKRQVIADLAVRDIVKTVDEIGDGRLARAGGALSLIHI